MDEVSEAGVGSKMNSWQVSLPSKTREEAADLLIVLSPPEDSFCRGRADLVWSCRVRCCRWAPDILADVWPRRFDVTGDNSNTEKAPSSPCAAEEVYFGQRASWCQKRHSLWGANHEQSEVLRTSTHPHRCTHMLRQTRSPDR